MSVNFGPQFFNKNNIPPKREVKPNEASELQGAESQNAPVYKENETTDSGNRRVDEDGQKPTAEYVKIFGIGAIVKIKNGEIVSIEKDER